MLVGRPLHPKQRHWRAPRLERHSQTCDGGWRCLLSASGVAAFGNVTCERMSVSADCGLGAMGQTVGDRTRWASPPLAPLIIQVSWALRDCLACCAKAGLSGECERSQEASGRPHNVGRFGRDVLHESTIAGADSRKTDDARGARYARMSIATGLHRGGPSKAPTSSHEMAVPDRSRSLPAFCELPMAHWCRTDLSRVLYADTSKRPRCARLAVPRRRIVRNPTHGDAVSLHMSMPRDGNKRYKRRSPSGAGKRERPQLNYTDMHPTPSSVQMDVIGVVRSPYKERFGTPRQPTVTENTLGNKSQLASVQLYEGCAFETALRGLSGFEYCWILAFLHLNKGWNPLIQPPRGPRKKQGLFATRAPHRPNNIGLSCVRIVRVDEAAREIHFDGCDLLDGTAVLDIKPYVPYCDAFPHAKAGWLDTFGDDRNTVDAE